VSSLTEHVDCRWRPSPRLLGAYVAAQALAWCALALLAISPWFALSGLALCLVHAAWTLPRKILLNHPRAWRALRLSASGWQLWREEGGWQAVQLRGDSIALPWLIVLRVRLPGGWSTHSVCIPADSLPADAHRRLRLRLKYSRARWVAPAA
jgi:toxin CptA